VGIGETELKLCNQAPTTALASEVVGLVDRCVRHSAGVSHILTKGTAHPLPRLVSASVRFRRWLLSQPVFTSKILPAIPRPVRWGLRKAYFAPVEWIDRRDHDASELVPPMSKNFTGSVEGFQRSGERLVSSLVELEGLESDSRVLDIGSGMGRLAVPLTRFLGPNGSYDGLDIVASGIEWCTENISARFPNFRFALADVYNAEYNPSGKSRPEEFRFPYPDDSFDVAVLFSVFTHMLPPEMEHYVFEISRVLRTGGRCFATYFLINDESRRLMDSGAGSLAFKHDFGNYWTVSTRTPELSVGYEEAYIRHLYEARSLFSDFDIIYGGWCGRKPFWSEESGLGDQDLVLATQ
jgi:SAM-dependent methyltransferase